MTYIPPANALGLVYAPNTNPPRLICLDLAQNRSFLTSNTAAQNEASISSALAAVGSAEVPIYGAPGEYAMRGTFLVPSGCPLFDGLGMTLNYQGASGGTYVTPTGVATASLVQAGGSFTAQFALNGNVSAGATSIVLSGAPSAGAVAGAWIKLVDKSATFNGARGYYYIGEDAQIKSVSGNTINFVSALKFGYTAAGTEVNLANVSNTVIRNLNVIGAGDGTGSNLNVPIRLYVGGPSAVIENCSGTKSDYTGLELAYCIYSTVLGGDYSNVANYGGSDNYAIEIANGTGVRVTGSRVGSYFNAVDFGGYDSDYASVNYGCVTSGCSGEVYAGSLNPGFAFNMHGNCLDCAHLEFVSIGPVTYSGDNSRISGSIRSGDSLGLLTFCVFATELLSTQHSIDVDVDYSGGTVNANYGQIFHCGPNGSGLGTNTTKGGVTTVRIRAPWDANFTNAIASQCVIAIQNNGATPTVPMVFDISECSLTLRSKSASVTSAGKVFARVSSGNQFYMVANDFYGDCSFDIRNVLGFTAEGISLDSSGLGASSTTALSISLVTTAANISISPNIRGSVAGAIVVSGSGSANVQISNPVLKGYTGTGISVDCGAGAGTGATVNIDGGIIAVTGTNISITNACKNGFVTPGFYSGTITNSAVTSRSYAGQLPTVAFASLPSASVYVEGQRGCINDSGVVTYNGAAAGGGAIVAGVVIRGAAWVYG
ncbi:MAG: hypothetical protein E6R03_07980 [Hyphomicrobiaceae bacterium]|nr:MAG: hypothetical protein E6R03_07980 [Hyphomicrobiaceae bacterium]